jgi:hypothetical protein
MKRLKASLLILLIFRPDLLNADNRLLLYGTELAEESSYIYLGTILPWQYNQDTYFLRLWSDAQLYNYQAGGQTIDVNSKNLQLSAGKQFLYRQGSVNIYLGLTRNTTDLEPGDPGNDSAGTHTQGLLSLDGEYNSSSCDHKIIYGASYLLDQQAYWWRVRAICWNHKGTAAGFELVNHGDKNYNHIQLGGVLHNMAISDNTDYTVKAGLTHTQDNNAFPYIGIEFTSRY